MRIKNIIFDFDGTLVDTADDVVDCLRQAYQAVLPDRPVDVRPTHIGPQLKEIVQDITPGLAEDTLKEVMREFRRRYDNSSYPKTKLRGGISGLLEDLKAASHSLFIVTNKPKRATRRILEAQGLDCFREVVTPDFFPGRRVPKEDMIAYLVDHDGLDPAETLMIGDSELDVLAARKNNIRTLALLDGYSTPGKVLDSRPEFQVGRVADLRPFVKELLNHGSG